MSSASPFPPPPPSPSSLSYNSSLLIIATLLVFAFVFTAALHLFIRLFSPSSDHSTTPSSLNSTNTTTTTTERSNTRKSIVDSLPLFTPSSLPPCSPPLNCTICLCKFEPHEKLCILPACSHIFHSLCINTWIMSTPSCPLCRSTIQVQCINSEPPLQHEIPPGYQEQSVVDGTGNMTVSSWLKEYVDRLAISASSSMRWGSRRFDEEASGGTTNASATPSSLEMGESFRLDSGYFAASYKWILTGEA